METVDITVKADYPRLKIYIKGLLHLSVRVDKIIAFQSYIEDSYFIEYQTETTSIISEYWRRDLWEEILRKIEETGVF